MRICFTLDDVIRNRTYQTCKVYQTKIDPSLKLDELDMTNGDLSQVLGFSDYNDYEKFIYEDYVFDIFGKAPVTTTGVDKELNLWHIALQDYEGLGEEVQVSLANPLEYNSSICFTYFFLSKIATRIREVFFPVDSLEIWDKCDVLVTADPYLIDHKPLGKTCVKIAMPYNAESKADYTYDSLAEALNGNKLLRVMENGYTEDVKQAEKIEEE